MRSDNERCNAKLHLSRSIPSAASHRFRILTNVTKMTFGSLKTMRRYTGVESEAYERDYTRRYYGYLIVGIGL